MKIVYKSANGRMTFEFEAGSHKEAITKLAAIQELFEEPTCGCCKSDLIRFDVREFDGNSYYKLVCEKCTAQLDFGQHKVGNGLFCKRYDKETKSALPNRGWYVYRKTGDY